MMELYTLTALNRLKTNQLWIVQPKWYKFNYELTDYVFVYAKIYTIGFWQTTTCFETSDEVLSIKSLWKGGLEIKTVDGSIVGTITRKALSRSVTFTLTTGHVYTYRAPSVWKSECIWTDEHNNELIRINFGSFSGKTSVSFDRRATEISNFAALVFLAFKINKDNAGHG